MYLYNINFINLFKKYLRFVELIRGKYTLTNISYLQTIIDQLPDEKSLVLKNIL